ncbi:unnamed protein product [Rotaria socialis]|uniref:Uncharacterized protein n=1 Tax=Rotaria socialis TaxID=392032 RepID=A0A820YNY2_9BILA|nr:unnamed protein product [Rotaria socialis]CAF4448368.1 unnamed protein product [Rotaria socialis]CAF4552898.1 unnamed protein product [Rotaria socialis]CAF4778540.1 unnamed protein product [Rotaria socialis]
MATGLYFYLGAIKGTHLTIDEIPLQSDMFRSFILLIFLSAAIGWSDGTSPNWLGKFNVSPLCDQQVCCCLTGEVQVKEFGYFFMALSGKLAGQCSGLSTFWLPVMKPSTYTTKLPIIGVLNLNEDSTTLTAESPLGSQCNGRAVREQ